MAEISWIKLKTTMFDDEKIRLIQSMPEANAILVIWIRLLVLAGKTNDNGLIYIQRNMPYSEEMLSTLFNQPVLTVRLALQTLSGFDMIDTNEDGLIAVSNWEKHQNVEGLDKIREQNRLRKQRQRAKQTLLPENPEPNCDVTGQSRDGHATDIDKELDIDIDKELDKENKDIGAKTTSEQDSLLSISDEFETIWKSFPKKTNKKKAKEQFSKKVKDQKSLDVFMVGYNNYLKYMSLNDWYSAQELFRWIRDERYNDEYDLSVKASSQNRRYSQSKRKETLPEWANDTTPEKKEFDEEAEIARLKKLGVL